MIMSHRASMPAALLGCPFTPSVSPITQWYVTPARTILGPDEALEVPVAKKSFQENGYKYSNASLKSVGGLNLGWVRRELTRTFNLERCRNPCAHY